MRLLCSDAMQNNDCFGFCALNAECHSEPFSEENILTAFYSEEIKVLYM